MTSVTAAASTTLRAAFFASPAASYERLSHFVDAGLPGSVDKALDRWAIADGACRAAGASGASDVVLGADMYVIAALDALPATTDGPSRFTRAALAELPPACARAADVAESGGAPFASFLPADAGASLYAWRRALCNASWPDPAYMPQQQALTLGFVCAAACGRRRARRAPQLRRAARGERRERAREHRGCLHARCSPPTGARARGRRSCRGTILRRRPHRSRGSRARAQQAAIAEMGPHTARERGRR